MPAEASHKIAALPSKSAQDPARSPTFAPRTSASRKPLSDQAMGDICASVCSTGGITKVGIMIRSEEHTSELQSRGHLVCRLLLEKKKKKTMLRWSIRMKPRTKSMILK